MFVQLNAFNYYNKSSLLLVIENIIFHTCYHGMKSESYFSHFLKKTLFNWFDI